MFVCVHARVRVNEKENRVHLCVTNCLVFLFNKKIPQVEYVENRSLAERFQAFRHLHPSSEPIYVFHGTSLQAAEAILKDGFRVGGRDVAVTNGSA